MVDIASTHPGFLWVTLLICVPLILHLLNRQKVIKLDFSSLRFFSKTSVTLSKRRRLKQILLLICRMLIIICIILVFCGLYINNTPFSRLNQPDSPLFCILDPTISMEYAHGEISNFAAATALVDSLRKNASPRHPVFLYSEAAQDFIPVHSHDTVDYGRPYFGPFKTESVFPALSHISATNGKAMSAIFISDFQNEYAQRIDSFIISMKKPIPFMCVELMEKNPYNFGIRHARRLNRAQSTIEVSLYAQGRGFSGLELIALSSDIPVGRLLVSCKKDAQTTVLFPITNSLIPSSITIKLVCTDPFLYDNEFICSSAPVVSTRALVIGDAIASFPIVAALKSTCSDLIQSIAIKPALSVTADDIDSSSVIICNEVSQSTIPLDNLFGEAPGTRKLVVLSPILETANQSFNFKLWQTSGFQPLPARSVSDIPLLLGALDTTLTIWNGLGLIKTTDAEFHAVLQPIPGTSLLNLQGNKSFCTVVDHPTRNYWIVCTSPLGISTANNFWQSALFIPFIDRIVRHGLFAAHPFDRTYIAGIPSPNPFFGTGNAAAIAEADGSNAIQIASLPSIIFHHPGIFQIIADNTPVSYATAVIDSNESRFLDNPLHFSKNAKNWITTVSAQQCIDTINQSSSQWLEYVLWITLGLLLMAEMFLREKD